MCLLLSFWGRRQGGRLPCLSGHLRYCCGWAGLWLEIPGSPRIICSSRWETVGWSFSFDFVGMVGSQGFSSRSAERGRSSQKKPIPSHLSFFKFSRSPTPDAKATK
ncbi:hypothetical protein VTK56DRAFT_5086 [Thermocarpiscus australiensis]